MMKTFKEIVREKEGFFIDKNGHAVPDVPIHFKNVGGKKPSKSKKKHKQLKEDASGAVAKPKITGIDELPGQHKIPPHPFNNYKKGKMSDEDIKKATDAHNEAFKKSEAAHDKLSDELHSHQRKLSDKEQEHVHSYSEGEEGGTYSYDIAHHLINNHKKGREPTHGMEDHHKEIHHTISNLSKQKLGKEVHLYSGVGFNPKTAAKKSKDGIVHLPAHVSTSHDANVATNFADIAHSNNSTGRHLIHIHAKATDKGYHLGKHSFTEGEHETVIPAGTKLKYSHSTIHKNSMGDKYNVHHFTIHSQE